MFRIPVITQSPVEVRAKLAREEDYFLYKTWESGLVNIGSRAVNTHYVLTIPDDAWQILGMANAVYETVTVGNRFYQMRVEDRAHVLKWESPISEAIPAAAIFAARSLPGQNDTTAYTTGAGNELRYVNWGIPDPLIAFRGDRIMFIDNANNQAGIDPLDQLSMHIYYLKRDSSIR
jgi:hypothetical protein